MQMEEGRFQVCGLVEEVRDICFRARWNEFSVTSVRMT